MVLSNEDFFLDISMLPYYVWQSLLHLLDGGYVTNSVYHHPRDFQFLIRKEEWTSDWPPCRLL